MIRAAIIALALSVVPAAAQTQSDVAQTQTFLQAGFAQKYCGIPVPDPIPDMMYDFIIKTGYDQHEFLFALQRQLEVLGRGIDAQEIARRCGITLRMYRDLGLQR